MIITTPGVYTLPPDIYHADPVPGGSLSATRAKVLLEPGGPARFDWARRNPQPHRPEFDLGTAVHELALGTGAGVVSIAADSWRTKETRQARETARAEGKTPLLAREYARAAHLADQVLAHPVAAELLFGGAAEQAMFWPHPGGVWLRGQCDYLHEGWIVDVKTTSRRGPDAWARHAFDLRYHMQAAWYLRLARELGLGVLPFYHVVVETDGPGLVWVAEMDDQLLSIGDSDMDAAIALYTACRHSGEWPGIAPNIHPITAPRWAVNQQETDTASQLADELDALLTEGALS